MTDDTEALIAALERKAVFFQLAGDGKNGTRILLRSAAAALRSRQSDEVTEWEYGIGYEGDNGVEAKWFSLRAGGYTIREAAEHELNLYKADPQVQLIRRRAAGPWLPVPAQYDSVPAVQEENQ